MPNTRDFVAHVIELMRPSRAVAKAMFGGHGIHVDGLFVAIVVDDTLYLKSDDAHCAAFDALALPAFEFVAGNGRRVPTRYRQAPDEALESGAEMQPWLRLALASALAKPNRRLSRSRPMAARRQR